MGAQTSPYGKIVQVEGDVIKVPLNRSKRAFEQPGPFQKVVLSFVERLATQIAQAILCNRSHNIEQRLLRWLLMSTTGSTVTRWRSHTIHRPRCLV